MDGLIGKTIDIKKINRKNVFDYLYARRRACKQDIAQDLNLSIPTIMKRLNELDSLGLLEETGELKETGGRSAKLYGVPENAKIAVGLDIGEHHVTACCVNIYGEVIYSKSRRLLFGSDEAYYRKIGEIVREAVADTGVEDSKVLGVGIGLPGLVDRSHKKIFYGKILGIENLTAEMFSPYLPYPCMLENDAKAAGYAEVWIRPDLERAFFVLLSKHVGGAIISEHKVFLGDRITAGEFGHMVIIPHGRQCYCGSAGCVEPYCASGNLSAYTDGDLDLFFQKVKEGDVTAVRMWKDYMFYLSLALHNASMLMDIPFILGGEVGKYLDEYLDEIREMVAANDPFSKDMSFLQQSRLKGEAIAIGSALPYIRAFLEEI